MSNETILTPAERLVDAVLASQRAKGRAKYGKGLDASEGRDWPMEALQEQADATQYLAAEVVRLRALVRETRAAIDAAMDGFSGGDRPPSPPAWLLRLAIRFDGSEDSESGGAT